MGEIRSQDKRDKLRLLNAQRKPQAKALQTLLMDALQLCDDALSGATPGTFVSSTSEAGGSVSFQMLNNFSPMDAKRLIGELLDLYDAVVAKGAAGDDAIYSAMMCALKPIRRFRQDYTGLRYGIGYFPPNTQ